MFKLITIIALALSVAIFIVMPIVQQAVNSFSQAVR